MRTIKLLLVDDHLLFREGLVSLLDRYEDLEVVGEAGSGHQAIELARRLRPDIILLDLNMPGLGGLEACRILKEEVPSSRIIALTVARNISTMVEAVRSGASAYLTKDTGCAELVDTVRRVHHEGDLLEPLLTDRLLDELTPVERQPQPSREARLLSALSPRETQILKLLAQGKANKAIARELKISEHTVRNHISNIFQKLHVKDRTEAAVMAVREGMV